MKLSKRAENISESITLKMNERVQALAAKGEEVFNLTAGQLPFRPPQKFVEEISSELNFLKSYHYSPVSGFPKLKEKMIALMEERRGVSFANTTEPTKCIVSHGAKNSLFNALGTILNPGDEVIVFVPYWISYIDMIQIWGGKPVPVKTTSHHGFVPSLEDFEKVLNDKTRAIILNSPNNPAGIHYSKEWMQSFAALVKKFPNVTIISDEIYSPLSYFDPAPTYFYQGNEELLNQTIIIDGISKSLASTGLRLGYSIGPKSYIDGMEKLQGQSASGPNSLIQRALANFNFTESEVFLDEVRRKLRENSNSLRTIFRQKNLDKAWYQTTSAFYFMVDFSLTPIFENYSEGKADQSAQICADLLDQKGVALVPGEKFGVPNSARLSLVLEEEQFKLAIEKLTEFLSQVSA